MSTVYRVGSILLPPQFISAIADLHLFYCAPLHFIGLRLLRGPYFNFVLGISIDLRGLLYEFRCLLFVYFMNSYVCYWLNAGLKSFNPVFQIFFQIIESIVSVVLLLGHHLQFVHQDSVLLHISPLVNNHHQLFDEICQWFYFKFSY